MLKYKSETQNNALFMKLFIKHCLAKLLLEIMTRLREITAGQHLMTLEVST